MWTICFNALGTDCLTYCDGRMSIDKAHMQAQKHYESMVKLKGSFCKEYAIKKHAKPSDFNTYPFKIEGE